MYLKHAILKKYWIIKADTLNYTCKVQRKHILYSQIE